MTAVLLVSRKAIRYSQTLTDNRQGTNTGPLYPLPKWLTIDILPPSFGTIAIVVYATLYILMEPVAGALLAPLLLGGTAYSTHLTSTYGSTANYWAFGLFITSWIAQFVGHGAFEGRAPALFDNLVQAFFLAPLFVWMEILFYFGYRPELKGRIDKAVKQEVERFRKAKQQKNADAIQGKENGGLATI